MFENCMVGVISGRQGMYKRRGRPKHKFAISMVQVVMFRFVGQNQVCYKAEARQEAEAQCAIRPNPERGPKPGVLPGQSWEGGQSPMCYKVKARQGPKPGVLQGRSQVGVEARCVVYLDLPASADTWSSDG